LIDKLLKFKTKNSEFDSLKYIIILDEENYIKKDLKLDGITIVTFSEFE